MSGTAKGARKTKRLYGKKFHKKVGRLGGWPSHKKNRIPK